MLLEYSTDPNWCSKCKHLPCQCKSKKTDPKTANSQVIKMRREMKRGKPQTVLFELGMSDEKATVLLKTLQKSCGTGGSFKEGLLEIQGDHRDKIEQYLVSQGHKVKRAGG